MFLKHACPKPTFVVFSMVSLCFLGFFPIQWPCVLHVFPCFSPCFDRCSVLRIPVREITEVDEYSREAKDDVTFRSLGPGFKPWTEKKNWLHEPRSILDGYKLIPHSLLVSMGISTFTSKGFIFLQGI